MVLLGCFEPASSGPSVVRTQASQHAEYPVVAVFADREEVFQGTVDNNLTSGTAYVDVAGESSGTRCRGEGHLTDLGVDRSCTGGKGKCSLTCDDGTVLTCGYQLATCTSGFGVGRDQRGSWFAFNFGSDPQQARAKLIALRGEETSAADTEASQHPSARKSLSSGTGFFVSERGYVVTAAHVVENAKKVAVITRSGQELEAEIVDTDEANDLALLKADASAKALRIATDSEANVGEKILTIGYPLPDIQGLAQKATFGRVNALSGLADDVRYLQIDTPVQPGNSGGPVVDSRGSVIGIVEAILNPEQSIRTTGTIPQNVNYAVKSDNLVPLLAHSGIGARNERRSGDPASEVQLVKQVRDSVVLIIAK
jgi:S1-C subfamily serine protease